jgi:phage anti-repressor protein
MAEQVQVYQHGIPDAVLENIYNTLPWNEQPLEDEAGARPVEVDEVQSPWDKAVEDSTAPEVDEVQTDWREGVKLAAESGEEFPIDFEDGARWLGYSTKGHAKTPLISNFEENVDFLRTFVKSTGGRPAEVIKLTADCFKQFCMMAGTARGKEVRIYFLECERELKRLKVTPQQQQNILQDPVINMVLADMDKVGVAEAFKLGWKYESLRSWGIN